MNEATSTVGAVSLIQETGLTVFTLRGAVAEGEILKEVIGILENRGFDVLARKRVSPSADLMARLVPHGGVSGMGDDNAFVIAAYDVYPEPAIRSNGGLLRLQNGRATWLKERIGDRIAECLFDTGDLWIASRTPVQAWDVINATMPEKASHVWAEMRRLTRAFKTPYPVLKDMTSRGFRAKVELVDLHGRQAICKTFRPGREKFLEREVEVMRRFRGLRPEIPELLEVGEHYFILPFYQNTLKIEQWKGRLLPPPLLPLPLVKQALEVLKCFFDEGYAYLDYHPLNWIVDDRMGLKVIDFELVQRYETKPARFEQCFSLDGIPEDFEGDYPKLATGFFNPYKSYWRPYVGLSLQSLMRDPRWLQHARRFLFQVGAFFGTNARRAGKRAGRLKKRLFTSGSG